MRSSNDRSLEILVFLLNWQQVQDNVPTYSRCFSIYVVLDNIFCNSRECTVQHRKYLREVDGEHEKKEQ